MPLISTPGLALQVDAILPAGGRLKERLPLAPDVEIKALLPFNGETVLSRTIRTLQATAAVRRIVVVGPELALAEARASCVDAALPEGNSGPENMYRGLTWLAAQRDAGKRVLVVTTDAPFLTPEVITRFIDACPADADLCLPIVERTPFEARFAGIIRTDTRLKGGWYRLGTTFMLESDTMLRIRPHVEDVFAARKSNLQIARLIGFSFLFRYLTRSLTVDDIVAHVGTILKCRGAAVQDAPPEIAFDIDLAEEYAYACAHAGEVSRSAYGGAPSAIAPASSEPAPGTYTAPDDENRKGPAR